MFRVISKQEEQAPVIITNLAFGQRPKVLGSATSTTARLDDLTHHVDIIETGNESGCLKTSS